MHAFTFPDIDTGHQYIIEYLKMNGRVAKDERGKITYSKRDIICEILNPLNFEIDLPLALYGKQLLFGENPGFTYTYGNRFRKHFDIDQLQYILDKLKLEENSRRAIMVTWDVNLDTLIHEVPCLIEVNFQIEDKTLFISAVWRSQDMLNAWDKNLKGLAMLSKFVAHQLGVKVGSLTVHSQNAHIYETEL